MKERLKSPVLWTSIASLVIILMGNYGLWDYIGMSEGVFRETINGILAVAVALGVVNNPTDWENW
jgi:uncharacterized membrane protein